MQTKKLIKYLKRRINIVEKENIYVSLYLCVCFHNLNAINKCMENAWIIKKERNYKKDAAFLSLFLLLIFKADYLQRRVKIQEKQTKARKFLPFTCLHVSVHVQVCVCKCVGAMLWLLLLLLREKAEKREMVNNFECKERNMNELETFFLAEQQNGI